MRRVGSLFAGYGGLDLAVEQVLDADLAWVSEIEGAPSKILAHHWPDVPNHGDITAIDWADVEPVDVLTGGFPCQDVSAAGKRAGMRAGTRTGLWSHMAEAIDQLRPRLVVAENVRGLLSAEADSPVERCPWCVGDGPGSGLRALGAVLGDLADIGYDAQWCGLRAADVGAPHGRFRVFVVAWPTGDFANVVGQRNRAVPRLGAGDAGTARGASGTVADADRAASGERRQPTSGQAESRGARADAGRRGGAPDADTAGDGRHEGRPEPARHFGGPDAAERGAAAPDAEHGGRGRRTREPVRSEIGRTTPARDRGSDIAWGPYGPAIHRWERTLGRVAPSPTEPGRNGNPRLSPRFVEWMQGLADGWVTGVPGISRNDQLKALGNGVVPQQGAEAVRRLLPALEEVAA